MRKTTISRKHLLLVVGVWVLFAGQVSGATYLVWTNGTQTPPYDTWATAFSNIQDAVNYSTNGDLVWVTNGTYNITNQITITNEITVQSVQGATNTIVKRSGASSHRIFYLCSNAVVDGFTITNGYPTDYGGGVLVTNATVRNCIISGNTVGSAKYGGGVCCYSGGVVSNCTIRGNTAIAGGNTIGGAVCLYLGGLVVNCVISGNTNSGGVSFWQGNPAGTLRNCLIIGNISSGLGGGVYLRSGGTVENCTIAGNSATMGGGGASWYDTYGTMSNTICLYNTGPIPNIYNAPAGKVNYSCTTPLPSGSSGNIDADPLFVNRAGSDYRLAPGSPCINAGNNATWMTDATDLDGSNRIEYVTVDMGAYEFKTNALLCGFTADAPAGFAPHQVVFTGYVSGTNTGGLSSQWDFDGLGIDVSGPDKEVVTNVYSTSGTYTVSLTVTNGIGESNTYTRTAYIKAGPATNYVDGSGASPVFPYTNWATAATNIQAAIDAGVDGTLVRVTNGTYIITNQIAISNGIIVQSEQGATNTIVKRSGASSHRIFHLSHSNAVVDGFTITNGSLSAGYGSGVLLFGVGTVRKSIISGNTPAVSHFGGGVCCLYGGMVSNCTISGNIGNENSWGSGVACYYGGTVVNCLVNSNGNAGGVYCYGGGTIRNCLISGNTHTKAGGGGTVWGGGGLFCSAGTVQNCTIVSNTANGSGGGIYWAAGSVENSIIYFNVTNNVKGALSATNCCTTPAVAGTGNITDDPGFVDLNLRNYHLAKGSLCINTGTNRAWMIGAPDLDGNARLIGRRNVDMGPYQTAPPKGTMIATW